MSTFVMECTACATAFEASPDGDDDRPPCPRGDGGVLVGPWHPEHRLHNVWKSTPTTRGAAR